MLAPRAPFAAMHLKEVEITNFRCFEHLKMDFHPRMTVIVGANGAGKTALLEAVAAGFPGNARHLRPKDGRRLRLVSENQTGLATEPQVSVRFAGNPSFVGWLNFDVHRPDTSLIEALHQGLLGHHQWDYWDADRKSIYARSSGPIPMKQWFEQQERRQLSAFQAWVRNGGMEKPNTQPPESPVLQAVVDTIHAFLPELTNVGYSFDSEDLELTMLKPNGEQIIESFQSLSAGYRSLISMVSTLVAETINGDPNFSPEARLTCEGTILIDEIDLHLHPAWQRTVLQGLLNAFPKMQFIVTTHSPQIVASAQADWVRILDRDGSVTRPTDQTYGADSNRILQEIFGVPSRPSEIVEKINAAGKLLELKRYDDALQAILDLQKEIGPHDTAVNGLLWELNFAGAADAEDHQE